MRRPIPLQACRFQTSFASSSPPPARRATRPLPPPSSPRPRAPSPTTSRSTSWAPPSPACPARRADAPFLAIVGHIDEIGLIVTHIDDNGFLRFIGVGGWDPQILVGQRVELITRNGPLPGVVGRKAIHLLREEDRKKVAELRDLHIDIGAKDGDEARELVRIGDVAVIAGEPLELRNDRVVSRSMDNRLGAFIALEAARIVAEAGGAPGDVAACGVVQEEITFGGARTSAYSLQPDVAIVVDVTHETGSPGVDVNEIGKHEFGDGRGHRARLGAEPRRLRAAARGRRARGDPVHGRRRRRARRAPTPTRSTCRAPASRPAASRSRCATCTRPSRWSSSTTSTPARG